MSPAPSGGHYPGVLTESDLLRFRADGDAAAMEAIVGATRTRLLGVARRIGSPQDAEDSVQAAYHALLRRGDLPQDANVTAWLVTATVRIAYRRKAVDRREAALAERLARPGAAEGPSARAERREEDALVRRAVHRLPARYRDAMVLHHLEGLPIADVARLLDVPEATAKTRVQRGRALLRWRLAPAFAHAFVFLPWAAADAVRSPVDPVTLVGGGVMKSKLAAGAILLFALGAGVGLGAAGANLFGPRGPAAAESAAAPPSTTPDEGPKPGRRDAGAPPSGAVPGRSLDRAEIQKMVDEEVARALRRSGAEPPPAKPSAPVPANPELNADPLRRDAVKTSVEDLRRLLIEYDLHYEFDPSRPPALADAKRFDRYPLPTMWVGSYLGWVEPKPERYEWLKGDAKGFDPTRENGAWAFAGPLTQSIGTERYVSLCFADGVAAGAVVALQSYATVQCRGPMDGKLFLDSYATVVVDGDVNGEIVARSFNNVFVKGRLAGRYETKTYSNVYVMGGLAGKLVLDGGMCRVYVGGYTPSSALDGVSGKSGHVFLEASDLPVGEQKRGALTVTVLPPR